MVIEESLTLLGAVGKYTSSLKRAKTNPAMEQELSKFARWCGPEKAISQIKPSEVAAYKENLVGSGSTPRVTDRLLLVKKFLEFAKKEGLIKANLSVHVRIPKMQSSKRSQQDNLGVSIHQMTQETYDRHSNRKKTLERKRLPISKEIQKAAADKDVRENAPLEAAREQLGYIESQIREIDILLSNAEVVNLKDRPESKEARLGSKVQIEELAGKRKHEYTLVSQTEGAPLLGLISTISPLGKALIGMAEGNEVEVATPGGKIRYRLIKVS